MEDSLQETQYQSLQNCAGYSSLALGNQSSYMLPEFSTTMANLNREREGGGDCWKVNKLVCSVFSNALRTVKLKLLLGWTSSNSRAIPLLCLACFPVPSEPYPFQPYVSKVWHTLPSEWSCFHAFRLLNEYSRIPALDRSYQLILALTYCKQPELLDGNICLTPEISLDQDFLLL